MITLALPPDVVLAEAQAENPADVSARVRTQRGQTLRPHRPVAGVTNARHWAGAQLSEGISSGPLNGVQRKKELNSPTARLGSGTKELNTLPPVHAASVPPTGRSETVTLRRPRRLPACQ